MCNPAAIPAIMAIASAATTAYGLHSQRAAAKAQAKAMNEQAANERDEIQDAAEEELGERIRLARMARARARVAAGEAGAMGQSFAAVINQSIQDQDNDAGLVAKNAALQKRAVNDRLNTGLSQIRSPSSAEAGLKIATSAANGYSSGLSIKGRMGGTT